MPSPVNMLLIYNIHIICNAHNILSIVIKIYFQTFVDYFSKALQAEYKSKGITIQVTFAHLLNTNTLKHINLSFLVELNFILLEIFGSV